MSTTALMPWPYRLIITLLEPIFAFGGAIMVFRDPAAYLVTMTRSAEATPAAAGPQFIYTQLGGGWLYFAFVEAVVLRYFYPTDTRLWRLLCAGMLLSDAAYAHGTAQAVGGWAAWADLAQWTADDWLVFWTTAPMLAARVALVAGVGLGGVGKNKTKGI